MNEMSPSSSPADDPGSFDAPSSKASLGPNDPAEAPAPENAPGNAAIEASALHRIASGAGAAGLVALVVLALVSGRAFSAVVQMIVQVGAPLSLVGYVAWRRIEAAQARRSALATSGTPLAQVLYRETRAFFARGIAAFGGGFYGLIAGASFLLYQVRSVPFRIWLDPSAWRLPALSWPENGWAFLIDTVGPALWSLLLDVGTDWVDGFVYAMTWPVHLMDVIGPIGLGLAMGAAAGLHALARRFLPGVDAFSREVEAADPSSFWSPLPDELMPTSDERKTDEDDGKTQTDRRPAEPDRSTP